MSDKWPRPGDPDENEKKAAYYREYRRRNALTMSVYRRGRHLGNYAMIPEEYAGLLAMQDGCCWMCDRPLEVEDEESPDAKRKDRIDHDHDTGIVRGILCNWCNMRMAFVDHYFEKIVAYRKRDALKELYEELKKNEKATDDN